MVTVWWRCGGGVVAVAIDGGMRIDGENPVMVAFIYDYD